MDKISDYADQPIREFGETIVNMLSILSHGEIGGLGELMAMNLYLNNQLNSVFIYKIPVEPIKTQFDYEIAQKHIRNIHNMILGKLYTFWDTWCSDNDIVEQFQIKYKNEEFIAILSEMDKNIKEANDLVHALNVSDRDVIDLDFDPKKIALTDFINSVISKRSMPDDLLLEIKLKSIEALYEFNPQAIYEYHKSVLNTIYICFYWTTITHLQLGIQIMNEFEQYEINNHHLIQFKNDFIEFLKPLSVFDMNKSEYVWKLSPEASRNISMLVSFLLQLSYDFKNATSLNEVISTRLIIQKFLKILTIDMETTCKIEPPINYFEKINYENALNLMKSNYQAFTGIVAATSGFKEDRTNLNKLKKSLFFLSEAVEFDLN